MDRIAPLPDTSDVGALPALWQALDAARRACPDVSPEQLPETGACFALLAQAPWNCPGYDPQDARIRLDDAASLDDLPLAALPPLLTWCERGERFGEGHWRNVLENGRLEALMKRLATLHAVANEAAALPVPARIDYAGLNARQKENHNFQKVSALLADYGYLTLRLSDDWHGADFIAQHMQAGHFLRVQLKSRLTVARKYRGRGLHLCFPHGGRWYLCPHDALLEHLLATTMLGSTASWREDGHYSQHAISRALLAHLERHRL